MSKIRSKVYVAGDNIDTDNIIPAQYLNLVPTIPEEYEKLGSYAMAGLPDDAAPFVDKATGKTDSETPAHTSFVRPSVKTTKLGITTRWFVSATARIRDRTGAGSASRSRPWSRRPSSGMRTGRSVE